MDSVPSRRIPRWLVAALVAGAMTACDPGEESGPTSEGDAPGHEPAVPALLRLTDQVPLDVPESVTVWVSGEGVALPGNQSASGHTLLEVDSAVPDADDPDWWELAHLVPAGLAPAGTRVRPLALDGVHDLLLTMTVWCQARSPLGELVEPAALARDLEGALSWMEQEQAVPDAAAITPGLWRGRRAVPVVGTSATEVGFQQAIRVDARSPQVLIALDGRLRDHRWKLAVQELRGEERVALTFAQRETWPGASPVATRAKIGASYVAEVVLAPTPGARVYALPSMPPTRLSFSIGALRGETGRGATAVRFTIDLQQQAGHTRVFDEVLEHPRDVEAQGPFFHHVDLPAVNEDDRLVLGTVSTDLDVYDPVVLAAWGHPTLAPRTRPVDDARHGLVLVSLDTLRADRLGCYGSDLGLTPNLDALATESMRFTRASAHMSFTLPSHASLFSGQYPSVHGIRKPGLFRDPAITRWLAEMARERGYRTAAFTGGGQLNPVFRLDEGFEVYEYRDSIRRGDYGDLAAWLDGVADTPCFLFLHTYAAHHYEPPADCLAVVHPECDSELHGRDSLRDYMLLARDGLSDVDLGHLVGVYNASVYDADRRFGELVALLGGRGVLDRDPLIVVSDHGEGLLEHGQVGHGFMPPFEEQVHVPLMIRPAGGGPERVCDTVVELIDVLATALDLLHLPEPEVLLGQSLMPYLEGGGARSGLAFAEMPSGKSLSLRSERWKALFRATDADPDGALYVFDLDADPGEITPLPEDHPYVAEATGAFQNQQERLEELVRRLSRRVRDEGLDGEARRELEAVGYVDFGDPDH